MPYFIKQYIYTNLEWEDVLKMRCENLSKRLNGYTILFLIMDLIILSIDLFSCHDYTKFLFLISTIFIINCLFFDFCKKHVAYIKKSIFYIWQFTDENAIFGYIKLLVLILISVCYFAFYDYSIVPMIILAFIGISIMLIVMKRRLKFW